MINVTKDADDGRTELEELGFVLDRLVLVGLLFLLCGLDRGRIAAMLDLEHHAMLFGDLDGNSLVDRRVHGGEDPHLHQLRNEFEGLEAESHGEVADDHRRLHLHDLHIALLDDDD